MTQVIAFIFLLLFTALMIFIGVHASRKSKTMNEFLLGGRNIGPWISAFAYGTSYFSAVIFIGYAGRTRMDGGHRRYLDWHRQRRFGLPAGLAFAGAPHTADDA